MSPTRITSTLLTSDQRKIIQADTGINEFIIDRATDAFDALVQRGDVSAYKVNMESAVAQMGYGRPVTDKDRPTAVDKIKTILIKAYADRLHISYRTAADRARKLLEHG